MKIGILAYKTLTGGGEICRRFCEKLPIDSHFCPTHPSSSTKENFVGNTYQALLYEGAHHNELLDKQFNEYCDLYSPDIIIILGTPFSYNILKILSKRKIKTLVAPMVDCTNYKSFEEFQSYIDCFICVNRLCYDIYSNAYGKSKCKYLPYPIDTELFCPDNLLKLIPPKKLFVHNQGNGGAHWRKGTDLIQIAFNTLKRVNSKAECWVNYQDSLHPAYVLKSSKGLWLNCETFSSPVDAYSFGKMYLAPSRREGVGLPIFEAMACGLPVITNNIAPMNEVVLNPEQLIEVEPFTNIFANSSVPDYKSNIASLIKTVDNFSKKSDEEISELGENSRLYIVQNLSWEVLLPEYLTFLESCG